MRSHALNDESLARRVTRALAVGFSVTALGLNAWLWCSPKPIPVPPELPASLHRRTTNRASAASLAPEVVARLNAARASSDGPALESLLDLATHGAPAVAAAALEGIAQIGGERARSFLVQRLHDAPDTDLSKLTEALAQLSDPLAREALRTAARSPRVVLRSAAFEALATLDTDDVRDFMLGQLSGPDADSSIGYFADCRDPRAVPALERIAREGATDQRRAVLGSLFAQGEVAEPATDRLLRADGEVCDAVLDTRPVPFAMRRAVRQASIARLRAGAITTGSVFDFLEQDLSNEARAALVEAAHDPGSAERALSALATRGDRASLDALNRLAHDSDRGLSARAACALQSQPDSRTQRLTTRVAQRGT